MFKNIFNFKIYNTKIICNGNNILNIQTLKKELYIDLWSGNHPFYTGLYKNIDTEKKIQIFEKKFFKN